MDVFEEIVRIRKSGQRAALATIVHTDGSIPSYEASRMLIRDDGSIAGTVGGGCVEADVWAAAKEVIQTEQSRKMTFNLNHEPGFDSGHISVALARIASQAGFSIGIVDDRGAFANAERFPMASEILTSYEDAFEKIRPNSATYIAIVTRGHKDDMRVLSWAVETDSRGFSPRYIGMIGSRRKVISVYKALEKQGPSLEKFDRVHAPVGLDIGALTPEEIAVSITAELIAVRRNSENFPNKSVKLSELASLHRD